MDGNNRLWVIGIPVGVNGEGRVASLLLTIEAHRGY